MATKEKLDPKEYPKIKTQCPNCLTVEALVLRGKNTEMLIRQTSICEFPETVNKKICYSCKDDKNEKN